MRAVGRAMGAEYGNDICPKKFAFFKEGEMFYRPHYVEVDGVLVEVMFQLQFEYTCSKFTFEYKVGGQIKLRVLFSKLWLNVTF